MRTTPGNAHIAGPCDGKKSVRPVCGAAYAVWVGIGAALAVAWGVVSGAEPLSWAKILPIAGLVACAIGLKLVGETR